MPQRQNTKRFTSVHLQGEDSYVVVKRPTLGEGKDARRLNTDVPIPGDDGPNRAERNSEQNGKFLANRVVDWNWVDDDGEPLPLPKDDPTVLDRLTDLEVDFLIECGTSKGEEWLKRD